MADQPDRATLVAELIAAFPQAKITRETLTIYVRALADIPPEELQPIVRAHILEGEWFPTVRDLRQGVVERRLGLPSAELAWQQALEYAMEPATARCPAGCDRGVLPGGEPVQLDRADIEGIQDPGLRGMLEDIATAAAEPTRLCDTCNGEGEIPNPDRPDLAAPVKLALEHVGGARAIGESENIGILRAQFLKAYGHTREETIRDENLGSAGLALTSGRQRPAIEARTP